MQEYVAGPFVLVRESGKLAPGLITVSACLADVAPDVWAIEWASVEEHERLARAAHFGIGPGHLSDAVRWTTDHFDNGGFAWPNVFLDPEPAREFCRRFVTVNVRLLQMSLPMEMLESFLALTTPPAQQPGYAPVGSIGVHQALARRSVMADAGTRRGFEVLGFDGAAGFDSFRCNALESSFESIVGVRFNQWGLIDDLGDAARCAELANSPDVSTCAVEWHPWLLTERAL